MSEFNRRMARARNDTTRISVDELLFRIMPKTEALFLQYLIRQDAFSQTAVTNIRHGDFFLCTCRLLAKSGWSANEQEHYLRSLRTRGYVSVRRGKWAGHTDRAVRWVCIDHESIETALDNISTHNDTEEKRMMIPTCHGRKRKEEGKAEGDAGRRTATRSVRPAPPLEDDDMDYEEVFVADESLASPHDRPTRANPELIDRERARRLRAHVSAHGRLASTSARKWADAFRKLRQTLGGPASTIDDVLNWYIATDPAKPVVCDGEQFRQCYNWLNALYARSPKPVTVTADVRRIVNGLVREYTWPCDTSALPSAVQRSWDAYRKWLTPIAVAARSAKRGEPYGFARYLSRAMGNADDFVRNWFEQVNKQIHKWADWSGNLEVFVVRPDHANFVKRVRAEAARYGADDPARYLETFMRRIEGGVTETRPSTAGT